uniref:Peptidase S1 domain-containing protein n=2 Tax=Caenorhabditis japonica TaxID=281687 RepID=A0A8R1DLH8_CAEJA
MNIFIFFPLLFAVSIDAYQVSKPINQALQEKCGRTYQRKVINGDNAKIGDHPWAASLYLRRDTGGLLIGPSTVFSPSHLFGYNVFRYNKTSNMYQVPSAFTVPNTTCEGDHLVISDGLLDKLDVDFEHQTRMSKTRKFQDTVARIVVVNGCKGVVNNANLMIIELKNGVTFNKYRRPVCVSNDPKNWEAAEEFPVYGMNSSGVLLSANFAPTPCDEAAPLSCAKAVDEQQGLCSGDFGGSATAYFNDRATVLGIFAKGNMDCKIRPETVDNYQFVNVGYFHKEICEITGVCVEPPNVTSLSPEITSSDNLEEVITSTAVGDALYVTPTGNEPVFHVTATDPAPIISEAQNLNNQTSEKTENTTQMDLENDSSSQEKSSGELNSKDSSSDENEDKMVAKPYEPIKQNKEQSSKDNVTLEAYIQKQPNAPCANSNKATGQQIHIHIHLNQ